MDIGHNQIRINFITITYSYSHKLKKKEVIVNDLNVIFFFIKSSYLRKSQKYNICIHTYSTTF